MKRRAALCLWLALLLFSGTALAQTNPFPQAAHAYLVMRDDRPLWSQREAERLPPASLTKLMTALLVAESLPPDAVATISQAAASASGSRLNLRTGQRFRVDSLLQAMLLRSANDACRALAEQVAGSESQFVARMNARAAQLALNDTRFANACGYDASEHYSSTRDLATLTRTLLQHALLRAMVARSEATIATLDGQQRYHLVNTNALFGRYDGIQGVKTGRTARAGDCLIAYAVRGEREVLLVMLHARNRWWDAVDMIDLAFSHAN